MPSTGDAGLAATTTAYDAGVQIYHSGGANTLAVLDWLYKQFPHGANHIVVVGGEFGAYAATFAARHIKEHYDASTTAYFPPAVQLVIDSGDDWDSSVITAPSFTNGTMGMPAIFDALVCTFSGL